MIAKSVKGFFNNKLIQSLNYKNRQRYIFIQLNILDWVYLFFCFLIAVFYENNFGLLLSIIIFFVFFIYIYLLSKYKSYQL